jgi:glucose-1-phosphate cytidylyltransferase
MKNAPKVVILCGGKGTRAHPLTIDVPKPLLPIGDRPILHHVMAIYANQGYTDFVLAGGYKVECLRRFAEGAEADHPDWRIDVRDTGEDTNTGGRVLACRDALEGTFMVTYGDGLGDVDVDALLEAHRDHPGKATLTSVPLRSQYGVLDISPDGAVKRFIEKPVIEDYWINAGFFVFDDTVFDAWAGDDLERDVLPELANREELFVYRHHGFWKSADTQKELAELTAMIDEERAPWQS